MPIIGPNLPHFSTLIGPKESIGTLFLRQFAQLCPSLPFPDILCNTLLKFEIYFGWFLTKNIPQVPFVYDTIQFNNEFLANFLTKVNSPNCMNDFYQCLVSKIDNLKGSASIYCHTYHQGRKKLCVQNIFLWY